MDKHAVALGLVASLLVLASAQAAAPSGSPAASRADIDAVAMDNGRFAMDLYGQLAKGSGNLFFSPYSISTALAMTYVGARGETAKQMAQAMHFGLPQELLHPVMSGLMGTVSDVGKSYKLSTANGLWGQVGLRFENDFLNTVTRNYGAGFKEVDYVNDVRREAARKEINGWVEDRTNDKIKDLIGKDDIDALTRLILVNAIYFKGSWELKFKPEATEEMPFHLTDNAVDVPTMHQEAKFKYSEDHLAQALEMPYAGGDLSMVVLLPKQGVGLGQLENAVIKDGLQPWLSRMYRQTVDVYIPRFKLEQGFGLNAKLQALGMVDAFEEDLADFSGMTAEDKLHISAVIHKSYIEVNEEGTEAAAATAVIMGTKSLFIEEPPLFKADHPFIFAIRDLRTGSILFMGRLANPKV